MIRAISFDLDDTLWPVWPAIMRAERAQWQFVRERYPALEFDEDDLGPLRREVWNEYPDQRFDLTFLRLECLRRFALLHGIEASEALVAGAFDAFDRARNQVWFYSDALPALARLANRYSLISVSNGNASLSRTGIAGWFVQSLSAREAGAAKPDRAIFDAAASALGVSPGEILHIGDDPVMDVEGARAAGQQSLWLNRRARAWPEALDTPQLELTSLATLDPGLIRLHYE
ncbi:MAG: HAD-IA family hydrolase [Pseudomonadota bacterium]